MNIRVSIVICSIHTFSCAANSGTAPFAVAVIACGRRMHVQLSLCGAASYWAGPQIQMLIKFCICICHYPAACNRHPQLPCFGRLHGFHACMCKLHGTWDVWGNIEPKGRCLWCVSSLHSDKLPQVGVLVDAVYSQTL